VYEELDRRARGLAPEERARVARAILEEASRAELAPLLVLAVIQVESRFDPRAVSPVGAVGLMQLMVPTLRAELADAPRADPFDPVANVRAGVRYLGRLVGTFSDVELALVAYNAGPGRLRRHLETGGVPDRLRAYPRDVLREAVRLWPAPRARPVLARLALASAHAPAAPAPLRPGALALRGASRTATPGATALAAGAASLGREAVAVAAPAAALDVAEPPRARAWCRGACVQLQLGLPMTRGRERTGSGARTVVLA
jgi:hypothetical protein